LGCKLTIETMDGKLNIEVPQGTNSGDELRLSLHGMPPFQPPEHYDPALLRGDHVIKFKVIIPSDLTQEQRDLLKEFQAREQQNKQKYY
jgi:molecular chaperone DnaJ